MKNQKLIIKTRQAITNFSKIMEKKLKDNDHKEGWNTCNNQYLLSRMFEECFELQDAITSKNSNNICYEAADVANFAMMIADNCKK